MIDPFAIEPTEGHSLWAVVVAAQTIDAEDISKYLEQLVPPGGQFHWISCNFHCTHGFDSIELSNRYLIIQLFMGSEQDLMWIRLNDRAHAVVRTVRLTDNPLWAQLGVALRDFQQSMHDFRNAKRYHGMPEKNQTRSPMLVATIRYDSSHGRADALVVELLGLA